MKTIVALPLLLAFSAPTTPEDPLALLPTAPIDIEIKDASASDIYQLMEDVTATTIEVEPCEDQTLSLKLQAAPPALLLQVMGTRLGRRYSWRDDHLVVHCGDKRVSEGTIDLQLRDVPAPQALTIVAQAAGFSLEVENCAEQELDLHAENVTATAIIDAIVMKLEATQRTIDGTIIINCS